MESVQIPGLGSPAPVVPKKSKKKYKLVLDHHDGSISIKEIIRGETLDPDIYQEFQDLTEEEVDNLGTEIDDRVYDENLDIHCDRCNKFYRPYCRLHPLYKIPDRIAKHDEKVPGKSYSEQTLPILFTIEKSKIPNAGLGVFASTFVPIGMVFGPYMGIKRQKQDEFYKDGYAWKIKTCEKKYYVDGSHPEYSNWLRYINSPRYSEEQNILAFQTNGRIFYRVCKPIRIGEELLVWYGTSYGNEFIYSEEGPKPKKQSKSPFIL